MPDPAGGHPRAAPRSPWRRALVLAVLAFVVYNANARSVTSSDTLPARLLPISILRELDLDLDEFPFILGPERPRGGLLPGTGLPYFVRPARDHLLSAYPVVPAVLAVPVYALPVLLGLVDGPPSRLGFTRTEIIATILAKLAASAAVAASVGLVYLAARHWTSAGGALAVTAIYAFATSSWSVTSQGLWQTSMSQPLLALALHALVRARTHGSGLVLASVALTLSVACRLPNVVVAAPLAVYAFRHHRVPLGRVLVAPIAVGALLAAYNLYYFGSLAGTYMPPAGQMKTPALEGVFGLLVSPSRGLLVYSPVLLLAAAGAVAAFRRGGDALLRATVIGSVLLLAFYSGWSNWRGGFSYSYRHLVDLLPGLSLLLAASWSWITARRWRQVALAVLAAWSVGLQVIGAFFYPCGWYDGNAARLRPERYWSWTDPEFVRCLRAGPATPEGLQFLREALGRR